MFARARREARSRHSKATAVLSARAWSVYYQSLFFDAPKIRPSIECRSNDLPFDRRSKTGRSYARRLGADTAATVPRNAGSGLGGSDFGHDRPLGSGALQKEPVAADKPSLG